MGNKGRPDKYETHVKPRLDDIRKMCLYMTEKQVADALGVSQSAWCEYKKKYQELVEAIKKGRQELVVELKSTLIKKAKGFTYTEKKVVKKDNEVVREEVYERYAQPDVAALNLLLKNYDADNWANDPQALKLREKELELRKEQMEDKDW